MNTANSAPARASTSQPLAAPRPSSVSSASTNAGKGFHDVPPPVVDRPRSLRSRPQISHAYGSYVGPDGSASDASANARQTAAAMYSGDGVQPLRSTHPGI